MSVCHFVIKVRSRDFGCFDEKTTVEFKVKEEIFFLWHNIFFNKKIAECFTFSFYIKSKIFFGGKKFSRAVCLRSVEISLQKMVKNHQETCTSFPIKKSKNV